MVAHLNDGFTCEFEAARLPLLEPWHSLENSKHQLASAPSAASTQEASIFLSACVSAGKSAEQVRREFQTKRLQRILQDAFA
eukprot:3401830-Pyramimonas_sp.AAC.1